MTVQRQVWPSGTGEWTQPLTVVVARDRADRERLAAYGSPNLCVVSTPLELISLVTDPREQVECAVLVGRTRAHVELAGFLAEAFPQLEVTIESPAGAKPLAMAWTSTRDSAPLLD